MRRMPAESAVVAFARLPRPGQVKTRLAAGVGADEAAEFYRRCAEAAIAELGRLQGVAVYLFYAQPEDEAEIAAWLAPLALKDLVLRPQLQHADLGARMAHALQHTFAAGHRRAAIVGTDIPDLTAGIVLRALQALDSHQAVFGPAQDGGYYLLALSSLPHALFEGIKWSTSMVLAASVANAQHQGLSVAPLDTLPKLLDIDTLADLRCWVALQQQQRKSPQHTGLRQEPEEEQQKQDEAGAVWQAERALLQEVAQRIVQRTSESPA